MCATPRSEEHCHDIHMQWESLGEAEGFTLAVSIMLLHFFLLKVHAFF